MNALQVVEEQSRSIGKDNLVVTADAAIHAERRRAVGQVNPAIAEALLQNQELALRQVLDGRSMVD